VTVWESSWLTRQALVAVLLGAVVFGLSRTPWPLLTGLRDQVHYYLSTDLDLRGAAKLVLSPSLREKMTAGWQALPELWNRLIGRDQGQEATTPVTFIFPVNGTITSTFGYRTDPLTGQTTFHTGIDIAAAEGTPVIAALGGTVLSVGEDASYGKVVEIDHGQTLITLYAHAQAITVKTGDVVKQGDTIALVGLTGKVTSANCHFEVIVNDQPVDPLGLNGLGTSPP
jgi:murein DD-endopeptidase MepM/ murein hydrolase activator NlpD